MSRVTKIETLSFQDPEKAKVESIDYIRKQRALRRKIRPGSRQQRDIDTALENARKSLELSIRSIPDRWKTQEVIELNGPTRLRRIQRFL